MPTTQGLKGLIRSGLAKVGWEVHRSSVASTAASDLPRNMAAYERLASYSARYRDALADPADLTPFELRVFSQNGEDGVLAELLTRIGTGSRWFVEFGAGTGAEGCCIALADVFGWSGLFMEGDPELHAKLASKYEGSGRVSTRHAIVTAENVDSLLKEVGVPVDLDVLVIDIDGNDYWVWDALSGCSPRIVVIEYNSNLPLDSMLVRARDDDRGWDTTAWFSAGLGALEALGRKKGYSLVYTDLSGVNAFFLRNDELDAVGVVDPPRRTSNYGLVNGSFVVPVDADHPWTDVS